ncbi:peptide synthase [Pseudoalteromonas sp. P1-9]|uniref:TauD/TfdA family dioxygenase n=1 Tax=Pseudoalteromonas sp. P1-9 TaxID=1710354 RepID=UPI0006D63815|nr:TauD/TfdA family dioxygenase [Pseudoalteromonas sp. P1-9]KPV93679.1 peptide synthase [Pseudoalteromonas sp. P1-9]
MYTIDELKEESGLKFLLEVDSKGKKSVDWAQDNKDWIQDLVAENGALLIRGLSIHSSKQFGDVLSTLFDGDLLNYTYRSTPRTQLKGNVYTATEYPEYETIPQHNENAYSRVWPNRIGFMCMLPPETGGETPIADSKAVYEQIPAEIKTKFSEKNGVMYVRNYSELDLPWKEVFQTEEKSEVEEYCKQNEMEFEWLENDSLKTSQTNPATINHPVTNDPIWFNQAHLFHVSSLGENIRDTLLDTLGEDLLPRNSYFGDGSPINEQDLQTIRDIYEKNKIKFTWQKGDLLLLDNIRYTHGREPFTGARKILTGMACPSRN